MSHYQGDGRSHAFENALFVLSLAALSCVCSAALYVLFAHLLRCIVNALSPATIKRRVLRPGGVPYKRARETDDHIIYC